MDLNYTSGRKLNKDLINRLATCEYISEHRNLFITGATGCGKTYMACAFGMEACKQYYNTRYVRLPDLLIDLEMARTEGHYRKVMAKYANPVVLILDEWLLLKPSDSEQKDIFELLHRRRKKSTTIFCSQYEFEEWYEQLAGMTVLWQMQSLTALPTTATVSISQALIRNMMSQCERYTDSIKHYASKLA
jgi:DNA replication protein DnaC